jgi:hypothetical protein
MKELWLAILAAIGLTSAVPETAPHPVTPSEQYDFACEYLDAFYDVQCGDLESPFVIISRVVDSRYYGFYFPGENYIYINPNASPVDQAETIIHETTHYILHFKGDARFNRCLSEEVARRVHHLWGDTEYDDEWRGLYNCPKGYNWRLNGN